MVFYYPIHNDITVLLNVFVVAKIEDGATERSSRAADAATTNAPKENGSGKLNLHIFIRSLGVVG